MFAPLYRTLLAAFFAVLVIGSLLMANLAFAQVSDDIAHSFAAGYTLIGVTFIGCSAIGACGLFVMIRSLLRPEPQTRSA